MISNVLNLKQLEALIWVVDLGSFRKAADHLNTTQPNISSRIAGLEATLGVVLMQRDAGSVRLTDKGREILLAARATVHQAEQVLEIANRQDLVTDRLRLGVTELVACTWLHAFLRRIKSTYPSLNIELTVDLSRNLDKELDANHLDLAIQTAPFHSSASGAVDLGQFPYIWVAQEPIARELTGQQTVLDLMPHSILTHARHTQAYIELSEHVACKSIPTTRIVSSSSLASCVQMAADGMGVTLLPFALVETELKKGALRQIDVDWLPSPLKFAARFQSEKATKFVHETALMAAQTATAFQST